MTEEDRKEAPPVQVLTVVEGNQNHSSLATKATTLKDKLSDAADKAKEQFKDLVESENSKAAIEWTKKAGTEMRDQAVGFGKDALATDLGKAAAKGAAVGAVAAVPLPVIGPAVGAVIGAGVGAYLNLAHGVGKSNQASADQPKSAEILSDIEKLEALHKAGVVTEEEFKRGKSKLLKRL